MFVNFFINEIEETREEKRERRDSCHMIHGSSVRIGDFELQNPTTPISYLERDRIVHRRDNRGTLLRRRGYLFFAGSGEISDSTEVNWTTASQKKQHSICVRYF